MDSPSLFSQRLYRLFVLAPDLDPQSRFDLAESIARFISRQRPPLLQVDACIQIVRSQFVNPITPARVIDGAYVIDAVDVGRKKKSQLTADEFIKKRSFECGDEREQECSVCFENYRKHRKAVKTECNMSFTEAASLNGC